MFVIIMLNQHLTAIMIIIYHMYSCSVIIFRHEGDGDDAAAEAIAS